MKKNIGHPAYQFVVFEDSNNGSQFLTRSTCTSTDMVEWKDGNKYPRIKVEVSSTSHPYYTGKAVLVDRAGRVERFYKRYPPKK